jgi:hypothetical protein
MTTATKKSQLGAAALAIAAAAAVTPVLAQADSLALAPSLTSFAETLGSSASGAVCGPNAAVDCASVVAAAAAAAPTANAVSAKASATAPTIFKNNLLWLGNAALPDPTQNQGFWDDPNTKIINTAFTPLWVTFGKTIFPNLQFWTTWDNGSSQTCFLGFTQGLGGPYSDSGQITTGYNRKGCTP